MDDGNGKFRSLNSMRGGGKATDAIRRLEEKFPNHGGWFREGEIVELRGSRFRVKNIKPTQNTLKLLRRDISKEK